MQKSILNGREQIQKRNGEEASNVKTVKDKGVSNLMKLGYHHLKVTAKSAFLFVIKV